MFVCSRADFVQSAGVCRRRNVTAHGVSEPAHWASWMDTMPVIRKRHPEIAERLVAESHTPFLRAADAQRGLPGIMGFEPPSWQAAALGARPLPREPDDFEPSCVCLGWQHEASSWVEQQFRQLFTRVQVQVRALIRSQGGPGGGAALIPRAVQRPFRLICSGGTPPPSSSVSLPL